MIKRLRHYLDKSAFMNRANRFIDFQYFRNFVGYSLCCFRVFDENFIFELLAFIVIFR
ncbi:hypothetical protein T11_4846 [Trichinella zimbabwensis]|uniref:Uncharacterized protein n=1 Tax=Trichinella zimbabwensis TaxID=268475 RepID=A0A0V1GCV1_9BILA|nr:hypothetical protein T11_4846 [Trichinella zimbabwensis]